MKKKDANIKKENLTLMVLWEFLRYFTLDGENLKIKHKNPYTINVCGAISYH